MIRLSKQDWEQVNAWADGELADADAKEFAIRLKSEPALKEALASVHQVTSALSTWQAEPRSVSVANNINRRPWLWVAGATVAASISLVAFFMMPELAPSAIEVHRAYAAQEYRPPAQPHLRPAAGLSVDGFPLLNDANLSLVASRVQKNGAASAHFAGTKGCRLTVLRGNFASPAASTDVQLQQWIAGNERYQMIATGMDAKKFAAIATYLKQITQGRLQDTTVMALRKAVQSSTTCRRALS